MISLETTATPNLEADVEDPESGKPWFQEALVGFHITISSLLTELGFERATRESL